MSTYPIAPDEPREIFAFVVTDMTNSRALGVWHSVSERGAKTQAAKAVNLPYSILAAHRAPEFCRDCKRRINIVQTDHPELCVYCAHHSDMLADEEIRVRTEDVTLWASWERPDKPFVTLSAPYGETLWMTFDTREEAIAHARSIRALTGTYMTSWGEQTVNTEVTVVEHVTDHTPETAEFDAVERAETAITDVARACGVTPRQVLHGARIARVIDGEAHTFELSPALNNTIARFILNAEEVEFVAFTNTDNLAAIYRKA